MTKNLRQRNQGKRNLGFTLVELIVAIMIMAVLASLLIVNVSFARNSDVTACAAKLVTMLEKTRIETMSRTSGKVGLHIIYKEEAFFAVIRYEQTDASIVELSNEKLGNSSMQIFALIEGGAGNLQVEVTDETGVKIEFSKGSGEFKSSYSGFLVQGTKTAKVYMVKDTGRSYIGG